MTSDPEITPGRPIVLTPSPPGFWLLLGGGAVAALGPLFGFLLGSVVGDAEINETLSPIFLFLFIGILVGGVGVAMALLGVRRLLKHRATERGS